VVDAGLLRGRERTDSHLGRAASLAPDISPAEALERSDRLEPDLLRIGKAFGELFATQSPTEIEEIIGLPLPPSCRKRPAHWSSYEASAVAPAIQDADWSATGVNLEHEDIVLMRRAR
jgi:hypothetical protein